MYIWWLAGLVERPLPVGQAGALRERLDDGRDDRPDQVDGQQAAGRGPTKTHGSSRPRQRGERRMTMALSPA